MRGSVIDPRSRLSIAASLARATLCIAISLRSRAASRRIASCSSLSSRSFRRSNICLIVSCPVGSSIGLFFDMGSLTVDTIGYSFILAVAYQRNTFVVYKLHQTSGDTHTHATHVAAPPSSVRPRSPRHAGGPSAEACTRLCSLHTRPCPLPCSPIGHARHGVRRGAVRPLHGKAAFCHPQIAAMGCSQAFRRHFTNTRTAAM
jgi:hypothetical protein